MLIKHQNRSDSGFTLIEVLIVIGIIGVIAAVAMPNFNNWKQNADLNADMRRLYGFFQKARMEAVKRNEACTVVLTPDTYQSMVGADIIDSGAYADNVKMKNSTNGLNFSYSNRGLINLNTTITLIRLDQEDDFDLAADSNVNSYKRDLVINSRGRMRIE